MKNYPTVIKSGSFGEEFRVSMPDAELDVVVSTDVFGEKEEMCQLIVEDSGGDEPALHVRLNDDGTIAEILIREDIYECARPMNTSFVSDWLRKRDGQ